MLQGALLFALALSTGCFDPRVAECALSCAESACPSGYECSAAGLCRPAGSTTSCGDAEQDGSGEPEPEPGELVDRGLIARYFLDEAAGGTEPDRVDDDASDALDLQLEYGDSIMSYAQDGDGNRGLHFDLAGSDARASAAVMGTKIREGLDGAPAGTIEVVVMVADAVPLFSRIAHIGGQADSGDFTLGAYSSSSVGFSLRGLPLPVRWDGLNLERRAVLHLVFDAHQSGGRQIVLYVDGEPYPAAIELPTDTVIDIADRDDVHLVLGNREVGERSFRGNLFYAAYYREALSQAEVEANAQHLAAGDDDDDD